MKELQYISSMVLNILEDVPSTRSSDNKLYLVLAEQILKDNLMPPANVISMEVFLTQQDKLGLPGFETVRRSRQKIQADHPELRASEAAEAFRKEKEAVFREYATRGY